MPETRLREYERFLSGEVNVLSCTDLASRGLDTSNVKHVINYDFPLNMSDYIHRVGRVGRVRSRQGSHVTNLVGGTIQIHLVQQIEEAIRRWKQIPNVNNNIIKIIRERGAAKRRDNDNEEGEDERLSSVPKDSR